MRYGDGLDGDDFRRPRGEQHELIGEKNRLARIMRDEDRGRGPRLPYLEEETAQPVGGALVERNERLVKQEKVGLGGKGPRKRHAAREPKRQLLRIARQHVGNADGVSEAIEILSREIRRRHKLDILPDRPPRQEPRLLEHESDAGLGRNGDSADEAFVEAGHDAQERGFAAARRAHQDRHAFRRHIEDEIADGDQLGAVGADVRLLLDRGFQTGLLRQRVECRSMGCTKRYSIASMMATKASV